MIIDVAFVVFCYDSVGYHETIRKMVFKNSRCKYTPINEERSHYSNLSYLSLDITRTVTEVFVSNIIVVRPGSNVPDKQLPYLTWSNGKSSPSNG